MAISRICRTMACGLIALLLVAAHPAAASAQQGGPTPCATDTHRQFDFWVGEWEVTNAEGKVVGTNRISSILGGCVILEEWKSAGPYAGKSLNMYDAANDRWHQTWVDNGGLLLELNGRLEAGNMVLSGSRPGAEGAEVLHRITWEPLENGDVRQRWDTSTDDGATWANQFDGLYSPAE